MEMNIWSIGLLIIVSIYIVIVLFVRTERNHRKGERRLKERRVATVHIPVERRQNSIDRREMSRRA